MTRGRDGLTLGVPQRFFVTQQRALGDRDVDEPLTRCIPLRLRPLFEQVLPAAADPVPTGEATGPAWTDLGDLLRRGPA